ncbi:MAG: hypothetical protein A3G79_01970 [Gallionellales bacterium RIFCSPLOWO2_12_FULL_57_18]|nr:MAG: hypothetical protein A3H31_01110 [Gallionellales bacterium RIFCSPLOWO2_02_FULL_57_47]OGS94494.1 MAG: hypothetical protein A3G79_01970 [Gallionellales bacterium RIFCSPLOWO2_12_FULL_57_18]OGT10542.1 MAG: hypothetical protein A3J49_10915 [Gallionellales bacterium RIFCSPHIGHO2_02_FULL_57_16]
MMRDEPNALVMIFGMATIVWLWFAWDAYMQIGLYGSVLALFAAGTFLSVASIAAPDKELSWLYGWKDDWFKNFLRMIFFASIFVGPITRHIVEAVAPDFFDQKRSYLAVLFVSIVIGFLMTIYTHPCKSEDAR